jgi:hypothetical protein
VRESVAGGLVFGTLLGPEATGPGGFLPGFVCFWFPGCIDRMVALSFLGRVCVGCVVRGCCLRTT